MSELQSRFRGAIVGLAVGDALGFPVEFQSRHAIIERYGPRGVTDFVASARHRPGTYSDDTQMSIALADGLLDAGKHAAEDALMTAISARFVDWARSPENNRAPGNTCMSGCRRLAAGISWRDAGVADSKGCGSAMRVTALGLLYVDEPERLLSLARASSLPTHGHDAAVEGAAACALCVGLALQDFGPDVMLADVKQACAGRSADFDAAVERYEALRDAPPELALSRRGLGEAWVAEEAFVSALYCVSHSPDDFVGAVLRGANTDGDSDSIAAIAGSISGALNGLEAIPERWVRQIENRDQLLALADRLFAEYNQPFSDEPWAMQYT